MKTFLDNDFLLENEQAAQLYNEHAAKMPIIDYHCHLPPEEIASDKKFENLTKIWLDGDHYKWRAMRANGISEEYITGNKDDREKFRKWAETVPYTMRNPLYHWTHMELRNPFSITNLLNPDTADAIFEEATAKLQIPEFSCRNLMRNFKVETVCTTDDPIDTLEHHKKIKNDGFEISVLPAFRPDKAMSVESAAIFNEYLIKLEEASSTDIITFQDFIDAIKNRHDYFHEMGGRLSDHGLETIHAWDYNESEIHTIFSKIRKGKDLSGKKVLKFKSAMLRIFGEMDHEKGWTQQYHLGALRNNNSRKIKELGGDTGFDSIGDFEVARPLTKFLDSLEKKDRLTKTVLYNLNPRDNYLFATMAGNFNDGKIPGKIQFGSGWWFLDQKEAMEWQMNALSNLGLLSRFVGMLTDSRSFLSYPRHDYFRRILCNLIGTDVQNGLLPDEMDWLGKMVEDICYYNAKNYFQFDS
ncbi:glucuronate isomerase [Bacteroidota bacterium]